jgi:hypothetical protein
MKFFQAVLTFRFPNQKPEYSLGETSQLRFSQRIISLDCLTLENGTNSLTRNDDTLLDVPEDRRSQCRSSWQLLPYRIHLT